MNSRRMIRPEPGFNLHWGAGQDRGVLFHRWDARGGNSAALLAARALSIGRGQQGISCHALSEWSGDWPAHMGKRAAHRALGWLRIRAIAGRAGTAEKAASVRPVVLAACGVILIGHGTVITERQGSTRVPDRHPR